VRLDGTPADQARKLNRPENLRPIPPDDPDFDQLGPRNDSESITRALDDTLYLAAAHSVGHRRQHLNLLGFALVTNSLARSRALARAPAQAAAWTPSPSAPARRVTRERKQAQAPNSVHQRVKGLSLPEIEFESPPVRGFLPPFLQPPPRWGLSQTPEHQVNRFSVPAAERGETDLRTPRAPFANASAVVLGPAGPTVTARRFFGAIAGHCLHGHSRTRVRVHPSPEVRGPAPGT
jgi:hypothetical protein